MTPVCSPVNDSGPVIDKRNITSGPASVGTLTVAAPKQTSDTTQTNQLRHVSQKHIRYKIIYLASQGQKKSSKNQGRDRASEMVMDPLPLHNKFGVSEEIDYAPWPSSTHIQCFPPIRDNSGNISPITHTKSK